MKLYLEKIAPSEGSSFRCVAFEERVFHCPFHYHPEIEITYIESSSGRRFVGDHIGRFEPGDLVMIGSGVPHMYFNDEPPQDAGKGWARSLVVQFRRDLLGEGLWAVPEMAEIDRLMERSSRGIRFLGATRDEAVGALLDLRASSGATRIEILLRVWRILASGKDWESLSSERYAKPPGEVSGRRIHKAYELINKRFSESLTQGEVARALKMNASNFCRFFREASGKTFTRFLTEVRIGHACQLLQVTDARVLEICYACGFSNLSNFNRRFLECVGMTPRAYRAAYPRKDASPPPLAGSFERVFVRRG